MLNTKNAILTLLIGLAVAGSATAANVDVTANIATSTTWTANNVYNLKAAIYVLPGATLTIEAGTVIKSGTATTEGGTLAICRGAKIYVNGTAQNPVIMTSFNDNMTTWREACNEWGNLTVMGKGLISASHYGGLPVGSNTKTPTGLNQKQMEGLTDAVNAMYGGNDDNDDSGSISYLNLRYGGKVIGLANELNGLSLGGVGRETDIHHIEIMNNVDDGIEIWGGTVSIKYFSIWNIGDDSFDVDQGWRGKAQFGLIVQGFSTNAGQGSGVGDNCFEIDGAEDSDAQPVTTAVVYNCTVIGQPADGDNAFEYRDNARIQYRNMVVMDIGDRVVTLSDAKSPYPAGTDTDGANGYGYNGTLSWAATWTTPAGTHSTVNAGTWTPGAFNDPSVMYAAQVDGMLNEVKDSVFFRNVTKSTAYDEANARGVFAAANNNVIAPFVPATPNANMPIQALVRSALVVKGGKSMLPVIQLDPRAANAAVTSVGSAPADGFFTPAPFRGAFSPSHNWLEGWATSEIFGFITSPANGAAPAATAELPKIVTKTSFETDLGVVYTVEKSSDMKTWTPVQTVVGNGGTMSVEDLDTFEAGKFYRVVRL